MSQAFAAVKAGEESLLCRSYSRYPLAIVRGKGSRLWDVDGKEYVDLLAGIAVTALGHCNDEICAALEAQGHKLWHVSNLFYQEEQLELATLLLSQGVPMLCGGDEIGRTQQGNNNAYCQDNELSWHDWE